jgi:hypothetical protein
MYKNVVEAASYLSELNLATLMKRTITSKVNKAIDKRLKPQAKISSSDASRYYHLKHGEAPNRNGKRNTREYRSWRSMIDRCYQLTHPQRKQYAGKDIIVCERWRHDYLAFLSDMGRCPKDENSKYLILSRKDKSGNFEPTNCRWSRRSDKEASHDAPRLQQSDKGA